MDKQGKISSWQQQQQAYVAEAAKQIQFRKQQQKLRLMASAGQKPAEVSAESLIENILGKKETFQPVAGKSSVSNSNFQMAVDRPPHWLSPSSPLHPQLYREVWVLVRSPQGFVDTSKISPLLLTSGLSTNMLGYIWGLANCKIPGQLIENELYIILALVGLAQNGITFNSINVLNMIPQPPIPKLIFPNKQQISPPFEPKNKIVNPAQIDYVLNSSTSTRNVSKAIESKSTFPNETFPSTSASTSSTIDPMLDEFTEFQSANFESQQIPNDTSKEIFEKFPSVMILGGRSIGSRLANHSLGAPKIKSKQPQRLNNTSNQTEEFSDFHHHDLFPKCNVKPEQKTYLLKESAIRSNTYTPPNEDPPVPVPPPQAQQSLMSVEEDKYSALRVLSMSDQPPPSSSTNNDSSADEFGDFFSADFSSNQDEFSFADIAKRDTQPVQENPENQPPISFDLDEWSDFTSGDIKPVEEIKPVGQPLELFIIENESQKPLHTQTANLTINDTKSEITQQQPQGVLFFETDKPQLFPDEYNDFGEFVGPNEDNLDKDLFGSFQISQKDDTQSVSSLELPPLALSRHGSVPSLELKVDANNWDSSSQANDQQITDWIKCLEISLQIFQFCITTFEGVPSEQVFTEVVSTNEGKLYFKNVLEIFKVCARIKKSFIQTSSESKQLENLISTIDSLWNNFKVFYIKAGLSEEYLELIEPKGSLGNGSTCGICLLDTSTDMDIQIENKNKFYHVTCANLWANCINSNLPTPA